MYTAFATVLMLLSALGMGVHIGKHYNAPAVASMTMMPIAPPFCDGAVHAPAKEYQI